MTGNRLSGLIFAGVLHLVLLPGGARAGDPPGAQVPSAGQLRDMRTWCTLASKCEKAAQLWQTGQLDEAMAEYQDIQFHYGPMVACSSCLSYVIAWLGYGVAQRQQERGQYEAAKAAVEDGLEKLKEFAPQPGKPRRPQQQDADRLEHLLTALAQQVRERLTPPGPQQAVASPVTRLTVQPTPVPDPIVRGPRPVWRIVLGSLSMAGGAVAIGFGADGLLVNGTCGPTPGCSQVFHTTGIGAGLVGGGAALAIVGTVLIAVPGERRLSAVQVSGAPGSGAAGTY